jgi:small subunit ribosomal protein S1
MAKKNKNRHAFSGFGLDSDPILMDSANSVFEVNTIDSTHKVNVRAPYAQELYDLIVGVESKSPNREVELKEEAMLTGVVTSISKKEVSIDVAGKDNVYIPNSMAESKYISNLSLGQTVEVLITNIKQEPFLIEGSISKAVFQKVQADLEEISNSKTVCTVTVQSLENNGYNVSTTIGGNEITLHMPRLQASINKIAVPKDLVGEVLNVLFVKSEDRDGGYVASRKAYLESRQVEARAALSKEIAYEGVVTGATTYGVFVEFNECLTGMIHKANIHPAYADIIETIPAGTLIDFYVKEVIKDRIILTQFLRESLWDNIKVKQKLTGVVKDVKNFGVLIKLDDETTGLIHTSELAKIDRTFVKDQEVSVRVLLVNRDERKIFLAVA